MIVAGFQVGLQLDDLSQVDSIFLVKNPHPVHWGHISLLNADIACMEQLMNRLTMESAKIFCWIFYRAKDIIRCNDRQRTFQARMEDTGQSCWFRIPTISKQ